jgi:uncharacterized protein YcbX
MGWVPLFCSRCAMALVDPNTGARREHDDEACAAERARVEREFDAADEAFEARRHPDIMKMRF